MIAKSRALQTRGPRIRCSLSLCVFAMAALLLSAPGPVSGQALRVQSKTLRPRPELICVFCSITVSATPSMVTFTLSQGGVVAGSAPVVVTTTMTGVSLLNTINLYGYFSSSSAALTDGRTVPNNIPTSAVLGQMTTGSPTTFTAFTSSAAVGPAGAGLLLYTATSLGTTGCSPTGAVCRTDSLNLKIALTSLPQLPAGTYIGTLTLQAQVM